MEANQSVNAISLEEIAKLLHRWWRYDKMNKCNHLYTVEAGWWFASVSLC
jgi:hypothetical protein